MAQKRDYSLNLDHDTALLRLRNRVRTDHFWADFAPRGHMVGRVGETRFRLRWTGGTARNKLLAPILVGRLSPAPFGSRIRARISLSPFTLAALALGYVFVLFPAVMEFAGVPVRVYSRGSREPFGSAALISIVMGVLLTVAVLYSRWLLRERDQRLWNYLEDTFSDVRRPPDKAGI